MSRNVAATISEQELIVFFEEWAKRADVAPLTAEEFMRANGELEAAQRLAWLKRRTASERPEPPPLGRQWHPSLPPPVG